MIHTDIYNVFINMFPEQSTHIEQWFPNGRDSIRIRMNDNSDFIFTYQNPLDWCYETVDSYIRKVKGGYLMNAGLYENSDKDN